MKMYSLLSSLALVMTACESPKVVTPAHTAARFGRDPSAVHTLTLTGNHDSALAAWQDSINADLTHDTVWGVIPKGTITMTSAPTPWIGGLRIYTDGNYPNRVVDIGGYSKDSSIIYVAASAKAPSGGAFAFVVQASHVHFHDFSIVGQADSTTAVPPGAGNNDEAIRFDRYTPADTFGSDQKMYAEVNNMRIRGFLVGGIDVHGMKGAFIHDNEIFCVAMNSMTHYMPAMGIWMRNLAAPTPPGVSNGTIQANTIWDCGAEAIPIANVQHVQVRWNTISCLGGQSCPQGYKDKGLPSIGVALYNDGCADSLALSNNRIDDNHIYGNRSLTGGIVMEGNTSTTGIGYNNVIDTNDVHEVLLSGISDAPGGCSPGSIHSNLITDNAVDSTNNTSGRPWQYQYYDIYTNGSADTVSYNGVCQSNAPIFHGDTSAVISHTISGVASDIFIGNFHYGC